MYHTFDAELVGRALVKLPTSPMATVVLQPLKDQELVVKRIALPGRWIRVPEKQEIRQIPEGHCWTWRCRVPWAWRPPLPWHGLAVHGKMRWPEHDEERPGQA